MKTVMVGSLWLLAALVALSSAQLPAAARQVSRPLFGPDLVASASPMDGSWTPIPGGLRVEVKRVGATPYAVQVMSDASHVAVHVGDVLFITLESRSTSVRGGVWAMYGQQNSSPWTGYFAAQSALGPAWKRLNLRWVADKEIPQGTLGITIHVASQAQDLEFRGFEAVDLGKYEGVLPYEQISYEGRGPDAKWRAEADRKIDLYRKADLMVRVVGARGKPVSGVPVRVEQLEHAYEFGSFVEDPLLWNNADGEQYRAWFKKAYNKATTPMYWADWGWENPGVRSRYLSYPKWLKGQGIRTKAHVLIYPGWQFLPTRLAKLKSDPAGLWREMDAHIREKLSLTKPFGFVSWDVTNETRDLKDLPAVFGSEEIYARLFKLAHALDPGPTLFLNENTILTNGGKTESQQAEFERMLRCLRSVGAPLEGIGMQAHFGEALTSPTEIWRIVDRFAKFGLPIQITEFDLPIQDEAAQADYTRDLLTAWFAHPATTGFTMWGFWAGSMWQPAGALVDKNWKPRPNGLAWLDLVKRKWWTNTVVKTDRHGIAKVRVFKGRYRVTTGSRSQDLSILLPTRIQLSNQLPTPR